MPDTRDKDDRQHDKTTCGDADGSVTRNAGDVGRGLADAATDIVDLGTGLLGGLAGALDGLAGERASTRRTKIHPWELPPESEDADTSDEASKEANEYDEDYDRIH